MNLSNFSYEKTIISKIDKEIPNLVIWGNPFYVDIFNTDDNIIIFTKGKKIKATKSSTVNIELTFFSLPISDNYMNLYEYSLSKEIENIIFENIYSNISRLESSMHGIGNIENFTPIVSLLDPYKNSATFQTYFNYAVGGYAILKEGGI